jgi:hypothetical protein
VRHDDRENHKNSKGMIVPAVSAISSNGKPSLRLAEIIQFGQFGRHRCRHLANVG